MTLKEIIDEYKKRTGFTDAEIARRTGVARSTATRWSSGSIHTLSSETTEKLSELVGYNVEPLLKGFDMSIKLPVLGYVKAGYDLFAEENYLGEEEVSMEERRKGDYYLKVEGNSMTGVGIMPDSMVLVNQCSDIQNGKIGVVMIDQEVTVKRVIKKRGMLILEAANPDVENRYFTAEEVKNLPVRIIGEVVSCKTYF